MRQTSGNIRYSLQTQNNVKCLVTGLSLLPSKSCYLYFVTIKVKNMSIYYIKLTFKKPV